MSRTAKITAFFGDEEHEFCLRWGELMELQEKRDGGPGWILTRLISNQWQLQDVTETLRLGLIGGGMEPVASARLVRRHAEGRVLDFAGPDGLAMLCVKILTAAIYGAPDEPTGKAGEIGNGSTISPTERSDSETSSVPAS